MNRSGLKLNLKSAIKIKIIILILLKLIGSIDGTTTLLRLVRPIKQRYKRRRLGNLLTQLGEIFLRVIITTRSSHLEHARRAHIQLDTLRAVLDHARRGPIVHLVMPPRRVPLFPIELCNAHARTLLVELQTQRAYRVARRTSAGLARILLAFD